VGKRGADAAAVEVDYLAALAAGEDDSPAEGIAAVAIDQADLQQLIERTAPSCEMTPQVSAGSIDGAVILSDHLEVIGFGGEIAGNLPEVSRVARASDLEGTVREWVRTDRVGTRHRSAYRLCHEAQDVLAVVVSQDGGLRFVRWHDGAVTYWDQVATGPWEA
jgi:hypothetical protein